MKELWNIRRKGMVASEGIAEALKQNHLEEYGHKVSYSFSDVKDIVGLINQMWIIYEYCKYDLQNACSMGAQPERKKDDR